MCIDLLESRFTVTKNHHKNCIDRIFCVVHKHIDRFWTFTRRIFVGGFCDQGFDIGQTEEKWKRLSSMNDIIKQTIDFMFGPCYILRYISLCGRIHNHFVQFFPSDCQSSLFKRTHRSNALVELCVSSHPHQLFLTWFSLSFAIQCTFSIVLPIQSFNANSETVITAEYRMIIENLPHLKELEE